MGIYGWERSKRALWVTRDGRSLVLYYERP
jgi:hypothetical protein